jgi:hypothetical protein
MQKTLILVGCVFIVAGIFLPWIQRLGLGLLPGDISFRKANVAIYFPIATCFILSLVLSLLFWLLKK